MTHICTRLKCQNAAADGDLYCSDACFDLDNDPNPIQPIARNKVDGFGHDVNRMARQPVRVTR